MAELDSIRRLPRLEWQLWKQLRKMTELRPVVYGDYAVQHPHGPKTNGRPRANVRYSTTDDLLYSLGSGTIAKYHLAQYRPVCERLVGSGSFRGADYTWGDDVIAGTASGRLPPEGEPRWRGAGTSHHLRQVIEDLAAGQS